MVASNPELTAICDKFFSVKNDCRGCPITSVCWEPVRPMTLEKIDEHKERMNEAARRNVINFDDALAALDRIAGKEEK